MSAFTLPAAIRGAVRCGVLPDGTARCLITPLLASVLAYSLLTPVLNSKEHSGIDRNATLGPDR